MLSSVQRTRLRQLDHQVESARRSLPARPRRGWIHAMRTALGMSMRQLAERMGSAASSSVAAIERNETSGAITLRRLEAAADALDCDVVYVLLPREGTVSATLEARARAVATQHVQHAHLHMELEAQGVTRQALEEQIEDLTRSLLWEQPRDLWDRLAP